MNATQDIVRPGTGERTETDRMQTDRTAVDWAEAEARFQCAKQALLDIQQQHCAAADELLLARAQMRQMLEAAFPGANEVRQPVSALRLETHGNCNSAAA